MGIGNTTDSFDTLIIGAGILGLWAARFAIGEGRRVCVLDKNTLGSGASGGVLGALMGHIPDGWNRKKEFQFQALERLPDEIQKLEEETGIDAGYRRCGRVMPLAHKGMENHVESWLRGAQTNWHGRHKMDFLQPENHWFGQHHWPVASAAPFGASFDTFAARVSPRGLLKALHEYASKHANVRMDCEVVDISARGKSVRLADGTNINGDEIIIANGVDAYRLLAPFMGDANDDEPLGRGVLGQAVMIKFAHDDTLPILYQDGTYIVPHQHNLMAIGSTSRNVEFAQIGTTPTGFDPNNMGFYEKAMQLSPMLKDAPIVERWAGIRPRNTLKGRGADPWFEKVPGQDNLIALMGGFKITFGIAHLAMEVARGNIEGPRRSKLNWVQ